MELVLVYLLFMFSGCASLIFEVIWFQLLELVFGSTTLAISTILVAYMLGLGVGALFAGRISSRQKNGVRTYGFIEIAIGLYALVVPALVALYPEINAVITGSLSFQLATVVRFLLSLVVFLLPTFLMGATLPILTHALTHNAKKLGYSVATLYGVNTAGAVIGVLATTFVLLPTVGLHSSNMIAACLSIVTGATAVLLPAPRLASYAVPSEQTAGRETAGLGLERGLLLASFAMVGASGLAYEVCWSRALGMVFGSSIYAFPITLATFLAGIAAGSLLIRRYVRTRNPGSNSYIVGLLLLAATSYTVTGLLPEMPDMLNTLFMRYTVSTIWLLTGLLLASVLIMSVPALLLGAMFPLVVNALAPERRSETGAAVGELYFTNTMGAAFGAFVAGFVMIPTFGIPVTVAVTAAAILFCAAALLLQKRSMQWSAAAAGIITAAVFVVAVPPYWNPTLLTAGVYQNPDYYQGFGIETLPLQGLQEQGLIYYKEGVNSTVSVHRLDGNNLDLRVNGKTDASLGDMSTQVLLGQIAQLFGSPGTGRYLVVGLASGITTGSIALHQPSRVDVLELEPAVIEASHFFDAYNHKPLENPRIRVIADDARAFIGTVKEPYDAIISEPSNPWLSGASSLFTKEFFQAARQALGQDGVLLQWLQLYGIDTASVQAVLSALRSQFPYLYGFQASRDDTDLLILARQAPLTAADLPDWNSLPVAIRHELNRIDLYSSPDLWSLLRLTPEDFARIIDGNPIENTDDNMFVALRSPWHLFDSAEEVLAMFQPMAEGVLAIEDVVLSADELAALALSHMHRRNDLVMAANVAAVALRSGESANGRVFTAELLGTAPVKNTRKIFSRLQRAVQLEPNGLIPRVARAKFFYDVDALDKALQDVQVALSLDPEYWPARRMKLDILTEMERYEDARAEAEILLQSPLAEVDHELWADAAHLAAELGRLSDGAREMTRYLQHTPLYPEGWSWLADVRKQLGQQQQSAVAAENATRSAINMIREAHRNARYLEHLGQTDEAIDSLVDIITQEPGYELARADLARLKDVGL
jgi:predicted membrane-bound spermidine synthase